MAVDAVAIGSVAVGSVFLYAGIKGYSIPQTIQSVVSGKTPAQQSQSNPITGSSGGSGSSGAPPGDTGTHGRSAAANQALAKLSVIRTHPGWATGQQWADWVSLWNQESTWNNLAQNPSSGALGIAQALGHGTAGTNGKYGNEYGANFGLSTAQAKKANDGDALYQIEWGINYIEQTYGSPSAAWAHEKASNWY